MVCNAADGERAVYLRPLGNLPLNPTFHMLGYAITFLIIAIIAAVLGFGGIAGAAAGIAKILFFLFLVLFIAALIFGRRKPPV